MKREEKEQSIKLIETEGNKVGKPKKKQKRGSYFQYILKGVLKQTKTKYQRNELKSDSFEAKDITNEEGTETAEDDKPELISIQPILTIEIKTSHSINHYEIYQNNELDNIAEIIGEDKSFKEEVIKAIEYYEKKESLHIIK